MASNLELMEDRKHIKDSKTNYVVPKERRRKCRRE